MREKPRGEFKVWRKVREAKGSDGRWQGGKVTPKNKGRGEEVCNDQREGMSHGYFPEREMEKATLAPTAF